MSDLERIETIDGGAVTDEAIMAALDDLEIPDVIEEPEIEELAETEAPEIKELAPPAEEPVEGQTLDALDADLAKDAVYAEASAETAEINTEAPAATKEAKPAKEKKPRAAKAPKEPSIERDLSALPAEAFVLTLGDTPSDEAKAELIAKRPTIKKVAEKFDQTIAGLHAGKKVSTYTMAAFSQLDTKKEVSYKDLIDYFTGGGPKTYGKSTATAQVGQIMQLFPLLGIADKVGTTLKLRNDSAFAEKLRNVIATA